MVFYRKYRPQTIEELDSKEVRDKLYNVLQSSSVAHAFLFTGPKGLGKTSAARIVAKSLNCERLTSNKKLLTANKKTEVSSKKLVVGSRNVEPCNKCEQCVSITNGTNLDVLEIDGASNRGIDEIRDLREKVKLSPALARKKVYIIDEVHMLTTEAFNALLKTLEEPPSHVVFILCTTEPHKVPATIKSRALHVQFRRATNEELVRSFERIIKAERIKADKEALSLIASLSDGSFRDGSKILEEVALSASSGQAGRKKITKTLVEKNYSISSTQYKVSTIIESLGEKDTKKALEVVAKLVNDGIEMKYFMEELISKLHSLMLAKIGVNINSEFIIYNSKLTIEELKRLIELLAKANGELKYAVLPQIPLELAIVEWGIQENGALVAHENSLARSSRDQYNSTKEFKMRAGENFVSSPRPLGNKVNQNVSPKIAQQDIAKYNENDALWTALIDKVKTYNHSIAGVLRGCSIKSYDGKSLIIEAKFKFHRDKLSEKKTQDVLEKVLHEVTKKNIKVEVLLKAR